MLVKAVLTLCMTLIMSAPAFAKGHKCSDKANYPEITKEKLREVATNKTATIFDVNSRKSFERVHVPNAIHFKSLRKGDELTTAMNDVLPKDKNALIVAYCGGPSCGAWMRAARKACEMGYTNIQHYKGGIKGWTKKS